MLLFLAALVLALEEWIWDHASAILRRIGRWPPLRSVEAWVRALSPAKALALFALPVLVVLPIKSAALAAIAKGHLTLGAALFVFAKVFGMGVLARVWQMTEPAITTYRWVRRGRDAFLRVRRKLYGWLHQQPVYRKTREMLGRLRHRGGPLRRFRALLRALRRARASRRSVPAPVRQRGRAR